MIDNTTHCAPDREGLYRKTGSCFTMEELKSITSSISLEKNIKAKTQKKLVAELKQHFAKTCTNLELCLNPPPDIAEKALKPSKPLSWYSSPREWLSTIDINRVMKQYERAYRHDYTFIGVLPIDFSAKLTGNTCVSQEMCRFMEKVKRNMLDKHKFGVVFNLDDHNGPGTHWVSLFCDLDEKSPKYGIYYYDSGGIKRKTKIPQTVIDFMNMVRPKDVRFKRIWNNRMQQYQNTECGMFAMLFIILCLEHPDEGYKETVDRIVTDKKDNAVNRMRDILYLPDQRMKSKKLILR